LPYKTLLLPKSPAGDTFTNIKKEGLETYSWIQDIRLLGKFIQCIM